MWVIFYFFMKREPHSILQFINVLIYGLLLGLVRSKVVNYANTSIQFLSFEESKCEQLNKYDEAVLLVSITNFFQMYVSKLSRPCNLKPVT